MDDVGEARDWLVVQLLDCHNVAQQHGFAEVARALDATLDLLSDWTPIENLGLGQVLPFRSR